MAISGARLQDRLQDIVTPFGESKFSLSCVRNLGIADRQSVTDWLNSSLLTLDVEPQGINVTLITFNLKRKLMTYVSKVICSAIMVPILLSAIPSAQSKQMARSWTKPLVATTGFNADCTKPVFDLPAPLPAGLSFDFVGLFNQFAPADGPERDALALQAGDCDERGDEFVATTVNQRFIQANNFPDADSRMKNRKTNEVAKIFAPNGARTFFAPSSVSSAPFPLANSQPSKAMTLDEFRGVGGNMSLKCRADGTAKAVIHLRGYSPNEVLTVWAIWLTTLPGRSQLAPLPLPFGGIPNTIVPNKRGFARFERELNYCPMDVQEDGSRLMFLDVATHLDGDAYGATPAATSSIVTVIPNPNDPQTAFTTALSVGTVALNRGAIPMTASLKQGSD